jgi:hypothetical protein
MENNKGAEMLNENQIEEILSRAAEILQDRLMQDYADLFMDAVSDAYQEQLGQESFDTLVENNEKAYSLQMADLMTRLYVGVTD